MLGNVINMESLKIVEQISAAQAPVDAAQENLNALLASRRSLDMTKTELGNLGVNTKVIDEAVKDLNKDLASTAADYAKTKIDAEKTIRGLRSNIRGVHANVETPVDYVKTEIKSMPLAADSVNMDVQYFSLDSMGQNSQSFADAISSFVSKSASALGNSIQSQTSAAAQKQVSQQLSSHKITGTLVISVSCTHKNASVLAPCVLNVDKGIKVWNHLNPKDKLVPTNQESMMQLAHQDDMDGDNRFSVISGMTFGSSFVGMVHILNSTDTTVSQSLSSLAGTMQMSMQMDAAAFIEKSSGGFGVNASMANDVKSLLSAQNISSHVTLICMGVIPSMVANDVKMGVEKFAQFDPQSSMQAISTIQNATVANQDSVKASADAARTGGQMLSMKSAEIKSTLSALAEVDDGNNKMLDVNSMMTALDDYLKKAADGTSGVPINYYLKDITKSMLVEMWVAKYYPGRYMMIQNDDSAPAATANGSGSESGSGDANASSSGTANGTSGASSGEGQ